MIRSKEIISVTIGKIIFQLDKLAPYSINFNKMFANNVVITTSIIFLVIHTTNSPRDITIKGMMTS